MTCRTYVHIEAYPLPPAFAGNPDIGQEHRESGIGKPRKGEDEPDSTLDNDEKIETTSHKGTEQNPETCNGHPPPGRQD
ncbi:hypothetical protein [Komagataeibacter sp. FNDCR2]|uniref:hypothetical protein n=1 Tax=Komagataeibacter sp. FNDCR2 TaxID=2878682 RepID=UPI001E4681CE|nr:hypothetical protein [Komagataeibacter sp. FNDCR2]MCE2575159.1 hypothetical protein [Komagataeibacter sp. FNDCR2]